YKAARLHHAARRRGHQLAACGGTQQAAQMRPALHTTAAGNHRGRHYLTTRPCLDRRAVGSHGRPRAILAFFRSGLGATQEVFSMCDYSLHNVKARPAKVGDKLTTHHFNTGTRGFAAPEDANTAVCVLPGTELAFAKEVGCRPRSLLGWKATKVNHTTAIFR